MANDFKIFVDAQGRSFYHHYDHVHYLDEDGWKCSFISTGNQGTNTDSAAVGYSIQVATNDVELVNELADSLLPPPLNVDRVFAERIFHAATFLEVQPIGTWNNPTYSPPASDNYSPSSILPTWWDDAEDRRSMVQQSCANILLFVTSIEDFISRASNVGRLPPDNPFAVLADFNRQRVNTFIPIVISDTFAADIIFSIKAYIQLLQAEKEGGIDFNQESLVTAQLSHIKLSFSGLGGSGNTASDILQFLPDADAVKKKNAADVMSVIDFSKRVPHLLFTMEYVSNTETPPKKGVLVGWRKISDASGYIITRREVFSGRTVQTSLDNEQLNRMSSIYFNDAKKFALSFMDNMDDKTTVVYFDPIADNEYYLYRIKAYQTRIADKTSIFSSSSSTAISPGGKSAIEQIYTELDTSGQSLISPWPAISKFVFQRTSLDWILAAVNTRASINRQDTRDVTRNYSYLSANKDFLFSQMMSNKLVKPSDVDAIIKNIEASLQNHGVNQTILSLLDDTGISYYFEGREIGGDNHFDKAGTETVRTSNLFKAIGSSIDPLTALIDLRSLASNLGLLYSSGQMGADAVPSSLAAPTDVIVVNPDETSTTKSEGELQFINAFGRLNDPFIDLTTFDGISVLMRVIRLVSDFGIDRRTAAAAGSVTGQAAPTTVISPTVSIEQLLDQPNRFLSSTNTVGGSSTSVSPELSSQEVR